MHQCHKISASCNILCYRMTKIYCHVNHCNAIVQYFATLHTVWEICNIENTSTLIFIFKNKCGSTMRQSLRQKRCRATYTNCSTTESLCITTKNLSHTIKQLFHQYHKIIMGFVQFLRRAHKLLEYCTQPIFCGIEAMADNYWYNNR